MNLFQDEYLKFMPDMRRLGKRFHKSFASLEDVVRIYQVVEKVDLLCPFHCFSSHSFQLPGLIKTIQGVQTEREALATLVEETYLKPFKVRRRIHPPVL